MRSCLPTIGNLWPIWRQKACGRSAATSCHRWTGCGPILPPRWRGAAPAFGIRPPAWRRSRPACRAALRQRRTNPTAPCVKLPSGFKSPPRPTVRPCCRPSGLACRAPMIAMTTTGCAIHCKIMTGRPATTSGRPSPGSGKRYCLRPGIWASTCASTPTIRHATFFDSRTSFHPRRMPRVFSVRWTARRTG